MLFVCLFIGWTHTSDLCHWHQILAYKPSLILRMRQTERNRRHLRITSENIIKRVQRSHWELNPHLSYSRKRLAECCLNHSATECPVFVLCVGRFITNRFRHKFSKFLRTTLIYENTQSIRFWSSKWQIVISPIQFQIWFMND